MKKKVLLRITPRENVRSFFTSHRCPEILNKKLISLITLIEGENFNIATTKGDGSTIKKANEIGDEDDLVIDNIVYFIISHITNLSPIDDETEKRTLNQIELG